METMASHERMLKVIMGEKPDRVPVCAFAIGYAARQAGLRFPEFFTDLDKNIAAQLAAKQRHGYDDGPFLGWADYGSWEFGGELAWPDLYEASAPRTVRAPVERPADVDRLPQPDPRRAGAMPLQLAFARKLRELGAPVSFTGGSPTTLVGSIVGKTQLLRWFLREPEALRVVYEKVTRFLLDVADAYVADFGVENVGTVVAAPLDSNELISGSLFERFGLAYQRRILDGLLQRGIRRFVIHLCGDQRQNLAAWASLPWPPRTIVSFGHHQGIDEVAGTFGPRYVTAGSLPTSVLAGGTPEDVYQAAAACIAKGKHLPGGYFLMTECEMPVLAPPANVDAMVRAARELGSY